MVISKDSKRKRKSPQPVESSPEMPKRTKVQAQRKFAQGQSAPASSYNALAAASSSSTTGPSTSSECREPPTEILPNKRPKPEDFVTFMCYHRMSGLPSHLDYLNKGKPKVNETPVKKPLPKSLKTTKKGKKGRPPKTAANKEEPQASTSIAASVATGEPVQNVTATAKTAASEKEELNDVAAVSKETVATPTSIAENTIIPPFAVRKRAEVIAEGNRRGRASERQLRNTGDVEKCNNSPESKRRSNRTNAKEAKPMIEPETDEDEEYFSTKEDVDELETKENATVTEKNDLTNSKATALQERKSETPSKESESGKSRKDKTAITTKKIFDSSKELKAEAIKSKESPKAVQKPTEQPIKEKTLVKRQRQKESPIFIPSPEPSGRMTRQRAFFEPVKVPHREDNDAQITVEEQQVAKDIPKDIQKVTKTEVAAKKKKVEKEESKESKEVKTIPTTGAGTSYAKTEKVLQSNEKDQEKNKSDLNVFDFSSDDEQPLVKAVKTKKTKLSPKKVAANSNSKPGRKPAQKKILENSNEKITPNETQIESAVKMEETPPLKVNVELNEDQPDESNKSKNKRGKLNVKKKIDQESKEAMLSPSSVKKSTVLPRQSRKKTKVESQLVNGEDENDVSPAPVRSQRPTRKTKEAAAIYMGIIGHKLQLEDDEDDDLSLNSFPDLPNVKEMEKMEIELKRNAAAHPTTTTTTTQVVNKVIVPKQPANESPAINEKPLAARRGRPPKQAKQVPIKREIEGMLVKKGALTKMVIAADLAEQNKTKSELSKIESEDEDFLLNEELNETKRKLEKSFSDSDDEPLAIKAHVKVSEKDAAEQDINKKSHSALQNTPMTAATSRATGATTTATATTTTLPLLPLTTKPVPSSPLTSTPATNVSPISAAPQAPSPFKTIEKKSPVPTSKILNVPATYGIPSANSMASNVSASINAAFNKSASTYLPQASPHYHTAHVRPTAPTHQFTAAKPPTGSTTPAHISAPLPPQSPLKYQAPPTTYPPPIEAYPSPKINPNFLTPKFDRTTMPRSNNFPSPSPMKFDLSSTTSKAGIGTVNTLSPKTTMGGASVGSTAAAAASNDPLKDEIGSILAANLMPSKEESGKIFGIASVSLAQSSGPDNTKCTLGKCGSIHKPVLGPVVPTEGYIGDQLSSKERRKAKVNMTHEQIQKWLIECSSNPDEILDDLDDDFDDNLRPNLFATTPPPTRDDKESTSFSSSSKATRDLGKSESAWSAKGPSLKATPVVASANRKEENRQLEAASNQLEITSDNEKTSGLAINLTHKASTKLQNLNVNEVKTPKEKSEKKADRKTKEDKSAGKESTTTKDNKQSKNDKEKEPSTHTGTKTAVAGKQSNAAAIQKNSSSAEPPTTSKQSRKRAAVPPTPPTASIDTPSTNTHNVSNAASNTSATSAKTPKRTPVYNQKLLKQIELKETTTTSHKKTAPFSYGAFSADNEKSIYSFDKDDDGPEGSKAGSKPAFQRQNRRDSQPAEEAINTTPTSRTSPTKKRAAAAAAEKANKEIANASQNSSVSLTLSPAENCKHVKVSLDAEKTLPAKTATGKAAAKTNKANKKGVTPAADSDSEGHTFYIPLQGSGAGCDGEGGIQGVAVKLGREGPDGPNQKVIMHATLVTKAQMGSNSKPLPDSMNVSDIVKTLISSTANSAAAASAAAAVDESTSKKAAHSSATPSTSAAAAANSAPNSLKNVPIGTVQPRFKASDAGNAAAPNNTPNMGTGSSLVRVNSSSSLFSGSAKSRIGASGGPATNANKKFKDDTPIKMSNNTAFPRHDDPTQMVEAPIFRPTEKEFADPIEFIERITPIAARFGICKIIPPSTFKPECRISDEMRFTAYNQYVHKMLHRWGPSAKELSAIKKYLTTQSIAMNHPPWIGGMEVDLPRLYHTVQELGGLKEVIEKKKWARVAEEMCIPKLAQDRVTKLDDIYCKYLLPYDTLSPAERQKLFDEVEADWAKREARARRNADRIVNTESVSNEEDDESSEDDDESEEEVDGVSMECIVKGRSMPLSQFYRIARNTMCLWFKNTEPTVNEVEAEFWRHVAVCDSHVCVHSGSIDSSGWGYGFPSPGPKGKGSNYARHPWNLKVLTNNAGSVLRSLGPVMGVTVPTLHVGMLFSACCWYRDPHGLSWIEYLHTGASKLWYGIPDDQSANFRAALTALIPTHCQNKTIWLPCDTVMVPPHMLTDRGVSLCRIEQKPGEFIVVFPRAYTSSVATGYVVSESVYFATTSWLDLAKDDFRDIHDSCEPAMFSLEQLLFALGHDQRVTLDALQQMQPMLNDVFEKETAAREQLKAAGVTSAEKAHSEKGAKAKKQQPPVKSIDSECDLCRANLYISMVRTEDGNVYCLQHALKNLNNGNIQAKQCKLIYAYNVDDIETLIRNLKDKIQQKQRGAVVNKKVK